MSELWAIVQRHVDRWGVTSATLARRMGSKPQTLDSWKHRGLKELPEKWLLDALARETGTPYGDVLAAVLRDIDYLPRGREGDGHQPAAKISAGSGPAAPTDLPTTVLGTSPTEAPQPSATPPQRQPRPGPTQP